MAILTEEGLPLVSMRLFIVIDSPCSHGIPLTLISYNARTTMINLITIGQPPLVSGAECLPEISPQNGLGRRCP